MVDDDDDDDEDDKGRRRRRNIQRPDWDWPSDKKLRNEKQLHLYTTHYQVDQNFSIVRNPHFSLVQTLGVKLRKINTQLRWWWCSCPVVWCGLREVIYLIDCKGRIRSRLTKLIDRFNAGAIAEKWARFARGQQAAKVVDFATLRDEHGLFIPLCSFLLLFSSCCWWWCCVFSSCWCWCWCCCLSESVYLFFSFLVVEGTQNTKKIDNTWCDDHALCFTSTMSHLAPSLHGSNFTCMPIPFSLGWQERGLSSVRAWCVGA